MSRKKKVAGLVGVGILGIFLYVMLYPPIAATRTSVQISGVSVPLLTIRNLRGALGAGRRARADFLIVDLRRQNGRLNANISSEGGGRWLKIDGFDDIRTELFIGSYKGIKPEGHARWDVIDLPEASKVTSSHDRDGNNQLIIKSLYGRKSHPFDDGFVAWHDYMALGCRYGAVVKERYENDIFLGQRSVLIVDFKKLSVAAEIPFAKDLGKGTITFILDTDVECLILVEWKLDWMMVFDLEGLDHSLGSPDVSVEEDDNEEKKKENSDAKSE